MAKCTSRIYKRFIYLFIYISLVYYKYTFGTSLSSSDHAVNFAICPTRPVIFSEGDSQQEHKHNRKQNEQAREEGESGVVSVPANELLYLGRRFLQAVRLLHKPLTQVVHFGSVVGMESLAQRAVGLSTLEPVLRDEVVCFPPGMLWIGGRLVINV